MTDEQRGLYDKFTVTRKDGRDQPGGDKEGAEYFVLCDSHDPVAAACLEIIADVFAHEGEPDLADALRTRVLQRIKAVRFANPSTRDVVTEPIIERIIKRYKERHGD